MNEPGGDLYEALKAVITAIPACPDSSGQTACPSCLAHRLAEALNAPHTTPLGNAIGEVPIFTPRDVQSLIKAAVTIDRRECAHESCTRDSTGFVLVPI